MLERESLAGRLRRSEEGGALIESAIVLPVLLLIVFAMIWFGMLLYTHIVVQLAAAQGARVGAKAYADDPQAEKEIKPDDYARGFARSVIQGGLTLPDLEAVNVQHDSVEGDPALRVTVAYRFRLLVPFMSEWGSSSVGSGVPVVHSAIYRLEIIQP